MMIVLGSIMMILSQPMSMVMVLLMMTFISGFVMYMKLITFWYSLMMMMVMISGVLVVFVYMASMMPNEKFEWSMKGLILLMILYNVMNLWEDMMMALSCESMWDGSLMLMSMFFVVFLLVVMMMTVWMSDWWMGPVRG